MPVRCPSSVVQGPLVTVGWELYTEDVQKLLSDEIAQGLHMNRK